MNKLLLLLLLFINTNTTAQTTKSPLLGKWELIEYEGNNGNKDYRIKMKDGQMLTFKQKNIVTDGFGNIGKYETKGNRLKITISKKSQFFIFYFYNDDYNKLHLTPVTDKFEIICDEGCAYIYNKE